MPSKLTMTRLIAGLVILAMPSAGCVSALSLPASNHPRLPDPPPAVVDALESAAAADVKSAEWVIDLDRYFQKQDLN